ncbi:Cyclin-dependent kinases regulatory subunit 1 [Collichthys lucidus]|uniref:Cyclin-dependent kinases regulatory subunit n=1 Tax=Collichthys lucidus TaxID=240159 RepID=A0A4U5UIH5_COLLU|nr:Cyclin-dependent kinases regulatory subunit 1 [Collichthys lucidus]
MHRRSQRTGGSRDAVSTNQESAALNCEHLLKTCRRKQIYYSDKYNDEEFEYRHVVLPKQLSKLVPTSHLMTEEEWRGLGVQQSQGWIHYMIHKPGQ